MNGRIAKNWNRVRTLGYHRDWENYRDLLIVLVQKELKVRYGNKALGYIWSIANPLASALVYFIAFSILMRVNIPGYPVILLSGIFPWQWFSNVVVSSPNVFVSNASIIKKVNFPRNVVLLCTALNHMIHFVVSIPVLSIFLIAFNHIPTFTWVWGIPVLLVIHFLMVYGIGLALASINLFFRDLERLTGIIMNFTFFLTPILYPLEQIPPHIRKFIWLNPAAPLIVSWRELFLYGRLEPMYLLYSLLYAIAFFAIGQMIYRKLSWKFAELI